MVTSPPLTTTVEERAKMTKKTAKPNRIAKLFMLLLWEYNHPNNITIILLVIVIGSSSIEGIYLLFFYYFTIIKLMFYRVLASSRKFGFLAGNVKFNASFDCNSCQKKIKNPQCNSCEKMINYFNLFSIPEKYAVDSSAISEKAKQLQKQFHPDKNVEKFDDKKFVEYSAYINNARSILLDDLKRAVYMMELKGINIDQQGKIQDSKFMADIFELQMEIEESTLQEAQRIKKRIQIILNQLKGNLNKFFQSQNIEKCKQFVYKYKYLHRALQNSKIKLEKTAYA